MAQIAELGAAFLCADLALTPEPGEDHAAYIQSWLKVLKNDKRAILSAAAHAQRAADYLKGLQPVIEENEGKQEVAAQAAAFRRQAGRGNHGTAQHHMARD
ncbi:zincin-like metallopeptidase domain-containing protein [Rhodovulum sulfidophilum]|uniref:zincin-like metallopeptidase domain-containing protein n=1 Tax=Rhodovulum sulfidophilum TaxID=35806 RepID=UPI000A8F0CC0